MTELLKKLCAVTAVSGDEGRLSRLIADMIAPHCESVQIDPLGSIIAFKRGKKRAEKKVLLDAHMDEVGLIITGINADGSLNFATVGGINTEVLLARRVRVGDLAGVIQSKPIHLLTADERKKMPDKKSLTIDIGAADRAEAERSVTVGDFATFDSRFVTFGDGKIKARALDDRVGCAILVDIILGEIEYDTYFSFTVQEEVGVRGARAAAFSVQPDCAIAVESTTAADIAGTAEGDKVCCLGAGAAISFMDNATLYDRRLFDGAKEIAAQRGIACQVKQAVAGGNNSGAIHQSRGGVRTLAVSVPCRYLHSAGCVIDEGDLTAARALVGAVADRMAEGAL